MYIVRPSFPPLLIAALSFMPASASFLSAMTDGVNPVPIEVRFTLTDLDNRPVANARVRLVLGAESGWQNAGQGSAFNTGADGKRIVKMETHLLSSTRKRPTSFLGSLLSGKEATDDLKVAVELTYAGHQWLYVADLHRFKQDGTVLLGDVSVFSKDSRGNFTREVKRSKDGGWLMADKGELALTAPGHEIADFLFFPDESDGTGKRWILNCQFKRSPDPVMWQPQIPQ